MDSPGGGRFPRFRDGDVHIIINGSRQYYLHSQLLRTHSSYFEHYLTNENGPPLTSKAIKRGMTVRWRFELEDVIEENGEAEKQLTVVEMNGEGYPVEGRGIALDLENGLEPDPVFESWDAVFCAMYGRPVNLAFQPDSSFTVMLKATYELLNTAEFLEVVSIITKAVEADFQSRGQMLHRALASEPGAWLGLSLRLHSRFLFRESVIHAVGQYNTDKVSIYYKTTDHGVPKEVLDLITKKHNILHDGLKTAQMKMLSYYPQNLHRDLTVGLADRDRIGRNSYSNDIFGWMALNMFRHFIAQNLAADETHHANDNGYAFFKVMAEGGEAYLRPPQLQGFYNHFPMTEKGKNVVNGHVLHLKEHCRQFAQIFMENTSQLDVKTYPSGYFTCAKVDWEDYKVLEQV